LSDKDKIKVITFIDETWEIMKGKLSPMKDFLSEQKLSDGIDLLFYDCLRLVLSEMRLEPKKYSKYPPHNYRDEDFVELMIKEISEPCPNLQDTEACISYIESMRKIIWGHIAIYIEDLVALLLKMTAEKKQKITDNDVSLLSYCMTVVFVECVLRTKESQMLEADFK